MLIGPDRSGAPLEVGVVDGIVVIHCMPARPKYAQPPSRTR